MLANTEGTRRWGVCSPDDSAFVGIHHSVGRDDSTLWQLEATEPNTKESQVPHIIPKVLVVFDSSDPNKSAKSTP